MVKQLKRILVLEDIEANANLIRFSLETISGFEVTHVSDARSAVECFNTSAYDLCLFDHLMPGMTGLDAMSEIREAGNADQVPFVFLTARSDPTNRKRLLDRGAAAVVAKPFDIMLLGSQLLDVYHAGSQIDGDTGDPAATTAGESVSGVTPAGRTKSDYRRF
jgi:CheY-like chemotaxis protein